MLKFESWPPQPGDVTWSKEGLLLFNSLPIRVTDTLWGADETAAEEIGQLVGQLLLDNMPVSPQVFDEVSQIIDDLAQALHQGEDQEGFYIGAMEAIRNSKAAQILVAGAQS